MPNNTYQRNIPNGWIIKTLADMGEFKTGGVDKKIKQDEKPVKLVNYMDVYKHRFIDDSIKFMEVTASDSEIKMAQVKVGDMLFTPSSETPDDIGHSAVVAKELPNTLFSYHLARLRFNEEYDNKIDINFRAYFCNSRDVLRQFERMSVGATRYTISKGKFESIQVLIPESKKEQQKIAEVLGMADEEITKTQEVIEATEKLKRGLMQQLFTRGIGHTEFKETKIGRIPVEWDVVSIRNSSIKLIDGDRGANYPKQGEFAPEGFCLFLSAKNVSKNGFMFDEVSFISKEKDQVLRKGKLERGDIVLTSRGTVGNVAHYAESVPFDNIRINSGMLIVRHGEQFDPVFLYRYFSSPQMEAKYLSMGSGSAQPQLPVGSLEQVEIPLVPISEQKEIGNIISVVNEKILVNKKLKDKLTLLKKGLMQDLLSGTVRTNI